MPHDAPTLSLLDLRTRQELIDIVREAMRAERISVGGMDRPSPAALLSLAEVGGALGVSTRTVQRLVRRGEIGTVQVGAARRVHPAALDAYVRSKAK